jgi:hypothetical protein
MRVVHRCELLAVAPHARLLERIAPSEARMTALASQLDLVMSCARLTGQEQRALALAGECRRQVERERGRRERCSEASPLRCRLRRFIAQNQ